MPLSWADDVAPSRKPLCAGVFASLSLPPSGAGDANVLDLGMLREGSHYRVLVDVLCEAAPGAAWRMQCEGGPGMQVAATTVPRPSTGRKD